jgi:asparagine synthase (glutamine-hydrolysing)
MCGIAGILRRKTTPEELAGQISGMLATLRHRGPDDSGYVIEEISEDVLLGLGHVRLSILDLTPRGHQPMISPCGRYILIYNGEIYNYIEIRKELGDDPILSISEGDTAVVLAALARWGTDSFRHFNGMWALAFYDRLTRRLVLSRDRMGVKPLYLYYDDQEIIFASEIKAILQACRKRFRLDRNVVARYLIQSITDGQEDTFFEGIIQFPPACFAEINLQDPSGEVPCFTRFWKHPYELETIISSHSEPTEEEIRDTFIDAVKIRLRSDVPVGVLLSGGLDSSSIVGAAKTAGGLENLQILSVVSKDPEINEEPFIDMMAHYAGCEVIKFWVDFRPGEMLDQLSDACWYNDQPLTGFASIAHRNLMRLASENGVTVILTGQGSDEQLAGYNKFLYFYLFDCFRNMRWGYMAEMLLGCLWNGTILSEFKLREAKRYLPWFRNHLANTYWGPKLSDTELLRTGLANSYREREWRDIRHLSLPMLLHHEDRMSMSWSREMRVPFMDYRLVELLAKVNPSRKLRHGWSKAVFRQAISGLIPTSIQWRRDKKGFKIPEEKWIRNEFQPKFQDTFEKPMLAESLGFVDRKGLKEVNNRFRMGDRTINYKDIFNVFCLEMFLHRFQSHITE